VYGVQAICRVLKISPSGYYEWLLDSSHPSTPSDQRHVRQTGLR
jgi:hypothetical protein